MQNNTWVLIANKWHHLENEATAGVVLCGKQTFDLFCIRIAWQRMSNIEHFPTSLLSRPRLAPSVSVIIRRLRKSTSERVTFWLGLPVRLIGQDQVYNPSLLNLKSHREYHGPHLLSPAPSQGISVSSRVISTGLHASNTKLHSDKISKGAGHVEFATPWRFQWMNVARSDGRPVLAVRRRSLSLQCGAKWSSDQVAWVFWAIVTNSSLFILALPL